MTPWWLRLVGIGSIALLLGAGAVAAGRRLRWGKSVAELTCDKLYAAARTHADTLQVDLTRSFWNEPLCVEYRKQ